VPRVILADNMDVLPTIVAASVNLIYTDPPFNTGRQQARTRMRTVADEHGDRTGFGGKRYRTERIGTEAFADRFDDFPAFLEPRLREARRVLAPTGSLLLHVDCHEVHYCKVLLDQIFGRECFLNEIIWAYDYGARATRRWPTKHDTILVYVKNSKTYYFDNETVDREPYMAPGLVTPEKVARGKLPTDVWWHTIVSPTGREKTGYATQKPEGILRRIIQASSAPNDWVLDFFAGSGTTGAVAAALGRGFVLVDENPDAIAIMRARLPAETDFTESGPGGNILES
jgi:site-specific DNA-methyltransferase (adenine-specific)